MDLFVVIVGLVVAVGTPLATYLGVIKGHKVAAQNAELTSSNALTSAREGHQSAERMAAANLASAAEKSRQDAVWKAIEMVTSPNLRAQQVGARILQDMLAAGNLDDAYQRAALEAAEFSMEDNPLPDAAS
ncbi:hypothetical protein GCU67_20895 [Modestobacter muralis]|uniref:Uncharacterized protein n=1 Tax=Modestobacter muralis TaxID=1608614 RepID=A0A6P0HDZ7_9ACTN|nr:hypothetical protein [Modestobacter muralis]NEK96604.1 hypothetical protein [Modestobacter muralis]NEN53523.1 hypothetical protein [Modestobacter muralis]